ncbi:hypothetical protein V5E97_39130 [Singulisphaera sp. Ch08]|uniref:Uncharacterized protein n=1 Tax=Singulisphaera sp. Ch08 TaxID=3120278 RepID=A0AAU7CGR5_9BACT
MMSAPLQDDEEFRSHDDRVIKNPCSSPDTLLIDDETFDPTRDSNRAQEATVRTIGLIYYLEAFSCVMNLGLTLTSQERLEAILKATGARESVAGLRANMVIGAAAYLAIMLTLGWGLRQFKDWARRGIILTSGVSLLLMTLKAAGITTGAGYYFKLICIIVSNYINAKIIVLLLQSENRAVFSRKHADVISGVPEVKSKQGRRDLWLLDLSVLYTVLKLFLRD